MHELSIQSIQERRSASEFVVWSESILDQAGASDESWRAFFLRNECWKAFRDETLPLREFLLAPEIPEPNEIQQVLSDNAFDAIAWYGEETRYIEVTAALDVADHHRDKIFLRDHRVNMTGTIEKTSEDGKKLARVKECSDARENARREIRLVVDSIRRKSSKVPPPNTDLVVWIPVATRYTPNHWASTLLSNLVAEELQRTLLPYARLYVIGNERQLFYRDLSEH